MSSSTSSRTRNGKVRPVNDVFERLKKIGGPFIVRVGRREPNGYLVLLARWENVQLGALESETLSATLSTYAGGGQYELDISKPSAPSDVVCAFCISIRGESRIPVEHQQAASPPPASPFVLPTTGWSAGWPFQQPQAQSFVLQVPLAEGHSGVVTVSGPRPTSTTLDQIIEYLQLAKRSLPES